MFNYITAICLIGLVILGWLWKKVPAKELYRDLDNDPVSFRSIIAFLWALCLFILIQQILF